MRAGSPSSRNVPCPTGTGSAQVTRDRSRDLLARSWSRVMRARARVSSLPFAERRQAAGWPVSILDVSAFSDQSDADAIGDHLGLPDSPAASLVGMASGRPVLLAIDAIDAASMQRGRPATLLYAIDDVISRARAHSNLVLLSPAVRRTWKTTNGFATWRTAPTQWRRSTSPTSRTHRYGVSWLQRALTPQDWPTSSLACSATHTT